MPYFLCHRCFHWVEPLEDCCPECLSEMNLSEADPTAEQLSRAIGTSVQTLGIARRPRKRLAEWGVLSLTTEGVFFVPDDDHHETPPTTTLWQSFVERLPSSIDGEAQRRRTILDREPSSRQYDENLPALLMRDPGVFFMPFDQIFDIHRTRKAWRIDSTNGHFVWLWPDDVAKSELIRGIPHSRVIVNV